MTKLNVVQEGQNKKDILMMEKYDFSAMVLGGFITEMNHNPKVVRNPEVLLEEIEKQKPDLLFYDWDYGEKEDRELLKKVREKFPELKIIVIRHTAQEINLEELESQYGINTIVVRPFSRREVVKSIKSLTE